MTPRERMLRAARFEHPDRIPVSFYINPSCWAHYEREDLLGLVRDHPETFVEWDGPPKNWDNYIPAWQRAGVPYTDGWGCVWETSMDGLTGAVTGHPLTDWDDFKAFKAPSPEVFNGLHTINWKDIHARLDEGRRTGRRLAGHLVHGHTFLTLTYIRGYEDAIFDMVDEEPLLDDLLAQIEAFNLELVRRFVDAGVEWMCYPEDLGMQVGPMLSPEHFRRYIKPSYKRLMAPAQAAGCVIHMHSDGDLRDLMDDLLDLGINVINPQDVVNGLEWMAEHMKGKAAIDLDIDRQTLTYSGTPAEIDAHIRRAVDLLGDPAGGLMLKYDLYPGIPLENVVAIIEAFEKYRDL